MRADYAHKLPGLIEAMVQLGSVVDTAELDPLLLELVKIRSSQINPGLSQGNHTSTSGPPEPCPWRWAKRSA